MYKTVKLCIRLSILVGIILGCFFIPRGFAEDSKNNEKLARLTPQEIEQNEKDRQDAINAFVKEGTELFKKGKYLEAKVQFEKALKLDATQPQSLDYLKKCDAELANQKNPKKPAPVVTPEPKSQEKPIVTETKAQKEQEEKQKQEEKKAAEQKAKDEAAAKKQQQAEELAAQKKAADEKKAQEIAAKEAAKKAEENKIAAEKAEKEKAKEEAAAKKQQQAEELAAQKKAKEEQIAAEKAAKQKEREDAIAAKKKADEEKIAQEKAAKETAPKTEEDRIAAEKAEKEKAKEEAAAKKQQQAEELAAQKKAADEKKAQEIAAKEAAKKAEEDKIAAEKAEKEKAKEEAAAKKQQQAEELAAQKKAKEEQIAAEKVAKQKEREDAIAAQKKAEEDRIAAEKAEKEKAKEEAAAKKQQQAEELAAQKKAADEKKAQEIAAKKSEEEQRIAAENAAKEKAKEEAAAKKVEEEQRMAAKKAEEEQRAAAKKAEEEQRVAAKKAEEEKKAQQEKLAQANVQQPPPAPAVTVDTKKQIRDGLNRGKQLYKSNKVTDLTQSVQEFQQVLAIDPGNSEAVRYLNLAQTKLENRQQSDAQKAAEEAAVKQAAPAPVVQTPTQSSVPATQPVVTVEATQISPQPSIDTVSSDEKARQEALKRADEEEKRVRAEREREDAAKKATEAEDHYKAGMTYLNQGQILKAHDEWETVLALVPNHQGAKYMIEETRTQYEAALEVQRKEQETARVEAENEKKMNDPIITIDVADQEIGDVLTQMGAVVGFNMVIGEGVKAKVSASFTNVSLKKALDTLLPINGFKYIRQGDIIQVSLDLRTKIYPLTDDQVKKLRFAMVEDKILQRELYGPDAKPKVPGQELTLDEQAHLLSITDSAVNIGKLDEFLQNLPPIRGEELITRVYTLRQGDAEEIRKLVQAVLSASPVKGIPDEERKVILEPGSNTLVIRDSVDNLKKVEEFLTDKHFLEKLTNQELVTKVYHLSSEENATTPDALARKAELVNNVGEVLETMLYAAEGREKAYEENRRIFKDPRYGTITVVDTQDNQRKIEDYVAQLPTGQEQKLLSKVFTIKNADPNNIRNLINQIIQESESSAGGGGTVGDYVTGTISAGAGNGLTFLDVTVELIQVTGDKTNPSARLYIYTPTRDREVTLTKGNSELVDEYRVRLIDANPQTQEAEIEIRLASFTAAQRANGNVTAPGYGQPQTGAATGAPGTPGTNGTTTQQVHRRPTLRVDTDSNTIIVLAFDPNDMTLIEEWINKLDVPILQVSIEAKFVDVNETQAKEMGVDWLVPSLSNWGSFKPVQDQLSFGGTVSGNPDPISNSVSQDPLIANLRNDSLMSGGTLFEFQTVGGLQMTLDTLEAQGVINLISSPRVVAVNGEQANLTVTESIPYLFPAAITYPPTGIPQFNGVAWAFDSINISLNFTPTVHSDGSIILDFSSPSTGTGGISVDKLVGRVPEEALLGSQLLNYLSPQLQENTDYGQPIIDNRNIQTRVSVKDGETIVMGGLIEENDHTAQTQVPLLGDIPVLGYLFKKSLDYKEKNRLFIFLTATIVQ